MSEHDDIFGQVRESFSGLHLDRPVEEVFSEYRARRRRQLSGITVAALASAVAATAMTLTLGAPAPAHPDSSIPPPSPTSSTAKLTAFSVTSGPGTSTTLVLHKSTRYLHLDPAALRRALARHGIPALVTVGSFCHAARWTLVGTDKVVRAAVRPGSATLVIDGKSMPPHTRLSIGLFPGATRILLIKDGARLSCGSSFRQPDAHVIPSGPKIRGPKGKQ